MAAGGWRRPLRECGSPPADNVEVPVGLVAYPQVRGGGEPPAVASSRVGGCRVRGLEVRSGVWPFSGVLEPFFAVFGVVVGPPMGAGGVGG